MDILYKFRVSNYIIIYRLQRLISDSHVILGFENISVKFCRTQENGASFGSIIF